MPPHSWADKDHNAVLAEMAAKAPTLLAAMDPKRGPRMHKTDTIDLGFIVSGAVDLVVETGNERTASPTVR